MMGVTTLGASHMQRRAPHFALSPPIRWNTAALCKHNGPEGACGAACALRRRTPLADSCLCHECHVSTVESGHNNTRATQNVLERR